MKKPLDKQNKVCYNKGTKKDLWGGHAPARGWIKGRKRIKPTPQINHKKSLKKIKKVLDKLKNLWYNKYVIKRGNLLDK